MTADAPVSRTALFESLRKQWAATEDAARALQSKAGSKTSEGWSVSDTFRHLIDTSHNTASTIREMVATGTATIDPNHDANNLEGVAKFAALDEKMIPIELGTAHGIIWMYIQRFSEDDLQQKYSAFGNEMTLAQVLQAFAQHEAGHVEVASKA